MTEREAELEGQVAVMRAALLRLEWGHWGGQSEVCPACRGSEVAEDETCGAAGHREGCLLAAALTPTAGLRASRILALVAEWERANAEHYACWQTPGYEREREEQLRERVHSVQTRLLEAAGESSSEGP
jgi:hypothetical protein